MHRYDAAVARHYATYRPPLHAPILARVLDGQRFENGLDIGCGTGWSSLALADYCDQVIGTDTSAEMVAAASPHPAIAYRVAEGLAQPAADASVDVVTLAGVLPYLDQDALVRELRRLARSSLRIVVYDFAVDTRPLKQILGLPVASAVSGYDHSVSLKGTSNVSTLLQETFQETLVVNPQEAAHLILASAERFERLAERFGRPDPMANVADLFRAVSPSITVATQCWVSVHHFDPCS